MAHHHRAPNHPYNEREKSGDLKVPPAGATTPDLNHSSREVEKQKEERPPQEKRNSIMDYQIAGFSWSFVVVISLIAIALLGMVLKLVGAF